MEDGSRKGSVEMRPATAARSSSSPFCTELMKIRFFVFMRTASGSGLRICHALHRSQWHTIPLGVNDFMI